MAYLLLFQSRGLLRAQDFAEEFEISERTVYRDMQALSEMGVPIMAMPGEGYRLMEGYYLPPITFSADEARALYLSISMLTGLTAPGPTQTAAAAALEKIRAVLPAATLHQVEALQSVLRFYAYPRPPLNFDDKTLVALQEAIHHRRVVHLHYHAQHSNEATEREVEPLELAFLDKVWILSGYCRLRQDIRAFRLDRIDHLSVRSEHFLPRTPPINRAEPGSFKPVPVIVRFDPAIIRWVKERQHFTWDEFHSRQTGDETIMVYQPRSFDQIENWLLSWGDKMEVLAPPELRERLVQFAEKIFSRHRAIDA